jgi:hypothetical protein
MQYSSQPQSSQTVRVLVARRSAMESMEAARAAGSGAGRPPRAAWALARAVGIAV